MMKPPLILVLLALLSRCITACNICGDGKEVGNPDAEVSFNTNPPTSIPCGTLQSQGIAGLISETLCERLPQYVGDTCECKAPEIIPATVEINSTPHVATTSGDEKKHSSKGAKVLSKISKASTKSSKVKSGNEIVVGAKSTKEKTTSAKPASATSSTTDTAAATAHGKKSSKAEKDSSKSAKAFAKASSKDGGNVSTKSVKK